MAHLDQLRDGLHISVSQIRTYLRCPRSFELRYVLGVKPAFKPVPFAFGSSFHSAVARFYLAVKEEGAPPPLPLVTDEFRSAWQRELDGEVPLQTDDDEPEDQGALLDKAAAMLALFYDNAMKTLDGVKVEGIEMPFSVPLADPDSGEQLEERFVGAFDLVEKRARRHRIVEFKTASRKYGADQIRFDLQPTGYSLAAKAIGLAKPVVNFTVVTKGRTPALQVLDLDRSEEDELEFQRVAVNVLRGVDAGAFPPIRSWACRSCPHHHVCRPPRPKLAVEDHT